MKISQKLLIIVCLTILEVSITVWAAFQISKGGTLHQLNSLHLKYNAAFGELVDQVQVADEVNLEALEGALQSILDQPLAALELISPIDRRVMHLIGVEAALELIAKDIGDVNAAKAALQAYETGQLGNAGLFQALKHAAQEFNRNSSRFEGPVTRMVAFQFKTMIPLILFISFFNICFISYLSRSISASIQKLIDLLRSHPAESMDHPSFDSRVSGELRELMQETKRRMRVELMNLETNQELQGLIDERTQSLHAATLRAQSSSEAKSRFLANMSHEIRTPMNGILCTSDLILQDLDTSDAHYELNAIIRDSASALLRLLNDILDFSKMESGKVSFERAPFDLQETAKQVAALMRPQAEQKQIEFTCTSDLGGGDRMVLGDHTRLRQILINLLGNALKFTDSGFVRCCLAVSSVPQGSLLLVVTIDDSGIGMTKSQLDGLFERFVQADESTTRKYGGTGLGMALSLELAHLMGGDLKVESEIGVGTQCTITLPLERAPSPAPALPSAPALEVRFEGERVLLVEDNVVNQKVFCKVLERLGIEVVLAENGQVALEKADDEIALVLMDIQMPVMDGIEATKELLARGWSKPIVALSANVYAEDQARFAEAGMVDFVPKPVERERLLSVLDRFLREPSGRP